ncbi:hypothetical protein SAMN04515692_11710 [Leifsonia sp. CL147]|nr:hypothetical protein SAMN04515694_12918 [Leifsonia sp. CL154]SFL91194.1 hypothetical protein SAMN04515692_11710 [Leifsonia sp. CL147]
MRQTCSRGTGAGGYADAVFIRKAFYWWLFPSAVVLPVWLLIGGAAFDQGSGWSFLGLLLLCPFLFVAGLVLGGIVMARRSVRQSRAVSWYDVGLFGAWHLAIIAFGFFPHGVTPWLAVAGVLLFVATFWVSLWQLWRETRRRVQDTFAAYERAAQQRPVGRPAGGARSGAIDGGEYIVVQEHRDGD